MDIKEILGVCDHTLLKQESTWEEIKVILDDAIKYETASVCIPPCYIHPAKEYAQEKVKLCTVIGFPNGNMTTASKVFETKEAIANGAKEIDMVINIGELKAKNYDYVLNEIRALKEACGNLILKVIIETCLLTEEESTGFSTAGATFDDIELFKKYVGPNVKIKAAGGISSMDDAARFIELGANRLGTSRIVKIVKATK